MNLDLSNLPMPVHLRTTQPMSDDELMQFCAANDALRVEREPNGDILLMTPAGFGSGKINSRITRFLDEWAEADGRGYSTDSNGGYNLPDGSMRTPDAGWVSRVKVDRLSASEQEGFAPTCPDFVIELRSSSDRLVDLHAKMQQWIANGAELAWMIDPKGRWVTVYRPGQQPEVCENPSSMQGTGCVEGFELVMQRVWG